LDDWQILRYYIFKLSYWKLYELLESLFDKFIAQLVNQPFGDWQNLIYNQATGDWQILRYYLSKLSYWKVNELMESLFDKFIVQLVCAIVNQPFGERQNLIYNQPTGNWELLKYNGKTNRQ